MVFKNGPSKICGRQPLKNLTWSILEYLDTNALSYFQYKISLMVLRNILTKSFWKYLKEVLYFNASRSMNMTKEVEKLFKLLSYARHRIFTTNSR